VASESAGYSLGFERPFFNKTKLYIGGELHDLTASDDQWQVSGGEASIASFAARRSYRDYYRQRGQQPSASPTADVNGRVQESGQSSSG